MRKLRVTQHKSCLYQVKCWKILLRNGVRVAHFDLQSVCFAVIETLWRKKNYFGGKEIRVLLKSFNAFSLVAKIRSMNFGDDKNDADFEESDKDVFQILWNILEKTFSKHKKVIKKLPFLRYSSRNQKLLQQNLGLKLTPELKWNPHIPFIAKDVGKMVDSLYH